MLSNIAFNKPFIFKHVSFIIYTAIQKLVVSKISQFLLLFLKKLILLLYREALN